MVTDPVVRRDFAVASGPVSLLPSAVASPNSVDQLSSLVRWASETGHSVVPRGAGTGMPGGNVGRGIALDMESHFRGVGPVDPRSRTVAVQAGAVAGKIDEAAGKAGLFLPALPSSSDRCTIGGMIANNAAGARSFRFGSIKSWVEELTVVLWDGRVARLRGPDDLGELGLTTSPSSWASAWPRVRKNSSGYDLAGLEGGDPRLLLVGSEGTLGVIVSAVLRLHNLPPARGVAVVPLESIEQLPAVARWAESMGFWACEFFGRRFLEISGLSRDPEMAHVLRDADAAVLLETGGSESEVTRAMAEILGWAESAGRPHLATMNPEAGERLWAIRHAASPIIKAQAQNGLYSTQFIEDSVVPRDALPDYLRGMERILSAHGMDAVLFGHAGDGNVHINPLVDRSDPAWKASVASILDQTAALVRTLGGTLAGEHGDGRIRAPYLETIWGPEAVAEFRRVKDALDPAGILNPGVILPLPGQDPLEGMGTEWE